MSVCESAQDPYTEEKVRKIKPEIPLIQERIFLSGTSKDDSVCPIQLGLQSFSPWQRRAQKILTLSGGEVDKEVRITGCPW